MNRRKLGYIALVASSAVLTAAVVAQVAEKADQPAAAAPAQVDPNKVVINYGDVKITAGEFSAFVYSLPQDVREAAQGPGRRKIAEEMVRMRLLSSQAKAQKLDETPAFKQQIEIMRDNILVGLLLNQMQGQLGNDDDAKKYYEDHKQELERVTARHILVSTMSDKKLSDDEQKDLDAKAKAKAEELRKQLVAKPDSFADVAKAESADPGSKEKGGELPPFTRGQMVKEFEDVAFSAKPNDISEVVKSDFGYHIIQVIKREVPPFDEVKDQIADQVRHDKFETWYQDIKKKANPTFDDSFFGPAEAEKPAADKAAAAQ